MDSDQNIEELRRQIQQLKDKVQHQENLIQGISGWEGNDLYQEVAELQAKRQLRQQQYKQLMKDHFQFVHSGHTLQQAGEQLLQEKLRKNVGALVREIDTILQNRTSKSSISSSMFDPVESMDWLLQDRQQKHIKEQQKIKIEIMELQKILESIK